MSSLEQQRQVTEQAYRKGQITQAQYSAWMDWYRSQQVPVQQVPLPEVVWDRPASTPTPVQEPVQQASSQNVLDFVFDAFRDPIGTLSSALKVASMVEAAVPEQKRTLETQVAGAYIGAAGYFANINQSAKQALETIGVSQAPFAKIPLVTPVSIPQPAHMQPAFTPLSEAQTFGYQTAEVGSALTVAVAVPVVAPEVAAITGVSRGAVLVGEGISLGLSQALKLAGDTPDDWLLSPSEASHALAEGALFSLAGGAFFKGVAKAAPSLVSSKGGRTMVGAGFGGGASYVLSGGDLEATGQGALLGGGIVLGTELLGVPLYHELRARLPVGKGGVVPLVEGAPTVGTGGQEVKTYISEPLEALGGRRLRVVADVTELPVGVKGVSAQSLAAEYTGKRVPTAHATLSPEKFRLGVGQETLLKGFPEMSKGFRSAQELYPFYSAPGSAEFVTVYGGYAGVGKGYAAKVTQVDVGGKATALVTLDTFVSPQFLRSPGESTRAYLDRVTRVPGVTGVAPETVLGQSLERQLVTTTAYSRFGVDLPGSVFRSEGKVGVFQVKAVPEGRLGKIPVVRTLFADYTTLDVVKGGYRPAVGLNDLASVKSVDLSVYAEGYGRKVSVPSLTVGSPLVSVPRVSGSVVESVGRSVGSPSVSVPRGSGFYPSISVPPGSQPILPTSPPKFPVSGVLPRFDRVVPRRARFSGKWVKQNVRVKTPWEMTATFGIKLPRKVVSGLKSVDRFDKRIVDVGVSKTFKTRVRVKRVGRKKRGKR